MAQASRRSKEHPLANPFLWALVCLVVETIIVGVTHTGTDVLALTLLVIILFAVERTFGDFLSDLFGPALGSLVLAVSVVGVLWYLLTGIARAPAQQLFATAEGYGFGTLWLEIGGAEVASRPQPWSPRPAAPTPSEPAPTSGIAAAVLDGKPPAPTATRAPEPEQVLVQGSSPILGSRMSTVVVLFMTPSIAMTNSRVVVRAHVLAGGHNVSDGSVDFSIDGRSLGSAALNKAGEAAVDLTPRLPGSFDVRAAYRGSRGFARSSTGATLTVLAGK